ncbi:MAG: hypothetical protein IPI85_11920 [Dehalococcoidia bacterium]|nr:hypothetical protein [Dehalococcoidia bacterium]
MAGPPVVKAGLGIEISKEDLGNEDIQVRTSGVVANLAVDEADALAQVRRFLSYLPSSVWDMPPRVEPDDDPERRDEGLLSVVPQNRQRVYDPRKILEMVLDRASFFEIQPEFAVPNHRAGAGRWLSGRRDDQQPALPRWLDGQGRGRESCAPSAALRHLPPPARLLLR